MFVPASAIPYSGYTVSNDSYIYRNAFGMVNIMAYIINAYITQNEWSTVAFLPDGFRPSTYAALIGYIFHSGENKLINCYVYANGEIKVNNPLEPGQYLISLYGSFTI